MESDDPAPALGRGLALLARLERDGATSLERLARDSGWPKTSVLRLLRSLCRHGLVERDPATKRYRALRRLVPVRTAAGDPLRLSWRSVVARLPADYPHTLELHAWDGRELVMVDRHEPEAGEVTVRARVGWRRNLDEFDALSQLAIACGGARVASPWAYSARGRRPVGVRRCRRVLAAAAANGHACDLAPNDHGVHRTAVAVRDATGRLVGAIAAARVSRDGSAPADAALIASSASA